MPNADALIIQNKTGEKIKLQTNIGDINLDVGGESKLDDDQKEDLSEMTIHLNN